MTTKPDWYNKHPCVGTTSRGTTCGTGYVECAQLWTMNLKCCKNCDHPGYRCVEPFTPDELADMQRYHAERRGRP